MTLEEWSGMSTIGSFILAGLLVLEEIIAWSTCKPNSILQVIFHPWCACTRDLEPVIVMT